MKANIRSPFHVQIAATNLTKAILKLYIYTGAKVGTLVTPTYTIESTAFSGAVTFEISELIRDYLDVTFGGTYLSQTVFCNYRVQRFISGVAQAEDGQERCAMDGALRCASLRI